MWTRKSVLFLGGGLLLLFAAAAARSIELAGIAMAFLAFLGVNFFTSRQGMRVETRRKLELLRVFEADSTAVDLTVTNASTRALFLEARDKLPRAVKVEDGSHYAFLALDKGAHADLRYTLRCPLLGIYTIGPVNLRIGDPFDLFFEERDVPPADDLAVLPRTEDLRKAALLSKLPMPLLGEHQVNRPGDGFDFFAIREYVAGDTQKMINWKASARTGKILVNQMERVTAAEACVLYDGRGITDVGPEDRTPRIVGARACASAVSWLHSKKDNVRFYLYTDHVRQIEPAPPERQVPQILLLLAELQAKGNVPLKLVVEDVLPTLKPSSPIIIVSPLLDDPTIVEAASILLANDMVVVVVSPRPVSFPGVDEAWSQALTADRERALRALRGFGAFVVDLAPGESLAAKLEKGVIA